ncbi:CTL-like protein [Cucumispora dikerogammari]|nr:CTL-like protein [Cucumispora dikerogammari]
MTNLTKKHNVDINNKFAVSSQRKLHDMWALILYLITLSIFIIMVFMLANRKIEIKTLGITPETFEEKDIQTIKSNKPIIDLVKSKLVNDFFIGDVMKIVVLPIFLFSNLLLLMYFFTAVFIHIAFILPIILSVVGAGICLMQAFIYGCVMLTVFSIASLILYLCVFRRLKFVAKPFKMSLNIMLACFGLFLGLIVFFTGISLATSFILNILMHKKFSNSEQTFGSILYLFFTAWTFFLISTVSQSAMSAITAQYIVNDLTGEPLVRSSMHIVFFSLGSACFAALILAIVYTVRQLVKDQINRNSRERGSQAVEILLMIINTFLSFLEDFLRFLTSWAMTVVALRGCKLSVAMKSVLFDIRTGFLTTLVTGQTTALLILLVVVYLICILGLGTRFIYLKKMLTDTKFPVSTTATNQTDVSSSARLVVDTDNIKNFGAFNTLPIYYAIITLIFLSTFTILIQKIMEMLYLIYTEEPEVIKRKDMDVYESMRQEEQYKGGYCC